MTLKEFLESCIEYDIDFSFSKWGDELAVIYEVKNEDGFILRYRKTFDASEFIPLYKIIEETLESTIDFIKEDE